MRLKKGLTALLVTNSVVLFGMKLLVDELRSIASTHVQTELKCQAEYGRENQPLKPFQQIRIPQVQAKQGTRATGRHDARLEGVGSDQSRDQSRNSSTGHEIVQKPAVNSANSNASYHRESLSLKPGGKSSVRVPKQGQVKKEIYLNNGSTVLSDKENNPTGRLQNFRNLPEALYRSAPEIFDGVPEKFLPSFKNPCWRAAGVGTSLQCLPYFFLAGMSKSGTTDLYTKLHKHPQIVSTRKEPQWWTRTRFEDGQSFKRYIKEESFLIAHQLRQHTGDLSLFIGDSSPSTFWDNARWRQIFPHAKVGPPYVVADMIGAVLPKAKIIVIFRDPVDRLHSDFFFLHSYNYTQGPSILHDHVTKFLRDFQTCLKTFDKRTCAYDLQAAHPRVRISIGMYSIYLRDWLKVFPRDQIKVLRFEDWQRNCIDILPELYEFLQLKKLDRAKVKTICNQEPANVNKRQSKPMLPETRQILSDFYQPFIVEMAEILRDERFLWKDG